MPNAAGEEHGEVCLLERSRRRLAAAGDCQAVNCQLPFANRRLPTSRCSARGPAAFASRSTASRAPISNYIFRVFACSLQRCRSCCVACPPRRNLATLLLTRVPRCSHWFPCVVLSLTFCLLFQLSASSAALDLAPPPAPDSEKSVGWSRVNRHRQQQSLSAIKGLSSSKSNHLTGRGGRPQYLRLSLDLKYISESSAKPSPAPMSPQTGHMASPPRLQSSYSANDLPTVKNPSGSSVLAANANNHAQQHFHNHNANMGRIPAGAMPMRHSRELSSDNSINASREQPNGFQSMQTALQPSAAPFGPSLTSAAQANTALVSSGPSSAATVTPFSHYYATNGFVPQGGTPNGSYGMPMLTAGMHQMNINGASGVNGGNMYAGQSYSGYGAVAFTQGAGQSRDSQARVMQHRRQLDNEGV